MQKIKTWLDAAVKRLGRIPVKWHNACVRHKSLAWVDDNIIWWLWDKPKDWYRSTRHWFYCNWNRWHWRLVKTALLSHPWDGGFILSLEECQIDKQIHWFAHHQLMVDEQYNEIVKSLRWAKHCIHVMNNDHELFHFDGQMKSVPQKFNPETHEWEDCGEAEPMLTGERTLRTEDGHDIGLCRIDMDGMRYVYDGPRVNRRNAARFLDRRVVESERFSEGRWDGDLYLAKCRHLYYRIREQYTEKWWD